MPSPLQRLYKTKLALLATVLTVVGAGLLLLAHAADRVIGLHWLSELPVTDVGSALFTTGLISILLGYLDARDAEVRANQRLRKVLHEEAPAIRDAVIRGFAFEPAEIARVASPQVLDQLTRNALAIQFGDQELADDLYRDLQHQVADAQERASDMRVSISLAPWEDGPAHGPGSMFVATIRREYKVVPHSPVLRFSCVSDVDEYRGLLRDPATTEVWYFEALRGGLDAAAPEVFDVVQFRVDGRVRPVRRSKRQGAQTITVHTGLDEAAAPREVTIAYTLRVLVQQHGHVLYLDFGKPCKGVQMDCWYGGCGIRHMSVLDFIASSQPTRVVRSSQAVPTPNVAVGFDGWVLPKSGVALVWVLEEELRKSVPTRVRRT